MPEFRDVPGLEHLLAVSRCGRVLRKARSTNSGDLDDLELKIRDLDAGNGRVIRGVRIQVNGKQREYSLRAMLRKTYGEPPRAAKAVKAAPEHEDRIMPQGKELPVAGYPAYTAAENGAICGPYGRPLMQKRSGRYYSVVVRNAAGKPCEHKTHKLILETFVGPRPNGMVACHGVGGALDNSVGNLRWDTPEANTADRVAMNKLRRLGLL
jgi:hypothetical protein